MTKSATSTQPGSPTKRPKHGGRPVQISTEIVSRVADRVATGIPLRYALALEPQPVPLAHWNDSLERSSVLARLFDQKCGLFIEQALTEINSATCKTLPGKCWTLERRWPEFFSTKAPAVSITNNNLTLIQDGIRSRAADLVRNLDRATHAPKRLSAGNIIDVTAEPAK